MKPCRVLGRWDMTFTDSQAEWDVWAEWERVRFEDMAERMPATGLLFDVGAEFGSISAVYAKILGDGARMVLFEPSERFWPGIRATWEANELTFPANAIVALVGDHEVGLPDSAYCIDWGDPDEGIIKEFWPDATDGEITTTMDYRYIHNDPGVTPMVTIDGYVDRSGHVPAAITIDVEGAELLVLRGAAETLVTVRPTVWCSIHPDLMENNYATCPDDLFLFMRETGYAAHHLGTDHEQHWRFDPDA